MKGNVSAGGSFDDVAGSAASGIVAKRNPLITVVTVVFNGAETLEKTILSVINQTYDNIEYIVIDGGSTDGTLDIIRKYEHVIDYWVSESDDGIYDAMNKGVRHTKGDWTNFMNGGDVFATTTILADLVNHLVDTLDVIYGDVEICYHNRDTRVRPSSREIDLPIRGMPACHQSMIIRTKWLRRFPYDLNFSLAADFDNLCHILVNGGKAERVQPVIARVSVGGVSRNNRLDVYREYEEIYNSCFGRDLFTTWYYIKRRILVRLKSITSRCWPSATI